MKDIAKSFACMCLLVVALASVPAMLYAQGTGTPINPSTSGNTASGTPSTPQVGSTQVSGPYKNLERIPGSDPTSSLVAYLESWYNFGVIITVILAVFMIGMGAFTYIVSSAGNAGKALDGKDMIYGAITGLILAMVTYLIFMVINPDLLEGELEGSNEEPGYDRPISPGSGQISGPRPTSTAKCSDLNSSVMAEINNASNATGVPPALLASFMRRECLPAMNNSGACSKNNAYGAGGAMQFIDSTWNELGCSGSKFNRQDALNCAAKKIRKDSGGNYSDSGIQQAARRYCGSCTDPKACGGDYCDGILGNYDAYQKCFI